MDDAGKQLFSPCKQVCSMENETGYCLGCGRSRLEIKNWRSSEDKWRLSVLSKLPERMVILTEMRRKKRAENKANRKARLRLSELRLSEEHSKK